MIPPPDLALLDSAAKDALIRTLIERLNDLMVRLEVLEAENAALRKENSELRVKLDLPPKTPDNSSTPPSQGHKASGRRTRSRRPSRTLGRIVRCIRTRPGVAMLRRANASIAGRMSQASCRRRSTPTTASRFPRSNPT